MSNLAINGGAKVRAEKFPAYRVFGEEERSAVSRVFDSGVFSRFLGCRHEDFLGGPEVRALEEEWAAHFGVKHAVAVNSATSALYCAVGASGAGPGDEVIVSPFTMSASATAALIFNAIPVFADIEEDFFCVSAASVEARITERTRAIIVVDVFGQPYDADAVNALARKYNLTVIEDCAQAPGSIHKGRWAGTLGDIGIYSLNYHKHIHTGEGGILVTDNDELADRLRLIRNHAEAVVEAGGQTSLANLLGFNFRMTEIEAAMARCQLKKLNELVAIRQQNVTYLSEKLADIPCLIPAECRDGCTHVYYLHPLIFNADIAGVHRNRFVEAVCAELAPISLRESEGVKISAGYVKPLYLAPLYRQKIAYGLSGCPWTCEKYGGTVDYAPGLCPTAEKMHNGMLITHDLMRPGFTHKDLNDVVTAFRKVWHHRQELRLRSDCSENPHVPN
jgi:perosamine synthetase